MPSPCTPVPASPTVESRKLPWCTWARTWMSWAFGWTKSPPGSSMTRLPCTHASASRQRFKWLSQRSRARSRIPRSAPAWQTSGAAIDTLLKMDRRVRAYVRADGDAAQALRERGVEIAVGDFTDLDAIRSAMEGIRSAYFLHPISPGIVHASAFFAQGAKEAGVAA